MIHAPEREVFQGLTLRHYLTVCFFAISTTLSTRWV